VFFRSDARQYAKAALTWVQKIPNNRVRKMLAQNAISSLASESPQEAVQFAKRCRRARFKNEIINEIASAWSRTNPKEAFDW